MAGKNVTALVPTFDQPAMQRTTSSSIHGTSVRHHSVPKWSDVTAWSSGKLGNVRAEYILLSSLVLRHPGTAPS